MKWYLDRKTYLFLITFIVFFKLIIYFSVQLEIISFSFGGGNDAYYYDAYANGRIDVAVNYWPVILKFFNELGLYSRDSWGVLLFFLSNTVIPYLFYKLVKDNEVDVQPTSEASLFLILFYPTIYFFSMDLYRDNFMLLVMLLSLFIFKLSFRKKIITSIPFIFVFFFLCYFLFLLRPYLGLSLFLSAIFLNIFVHFAQKVKSMIIFYILILILLSVSGLLYPILEYRGEVGFTDGGSSLGVSLLNVSNSTFLYLYFYSFFCQVFGLFLVNFSSVFVFVFESIPFNFALVYVLRNIRFASNFVMFLIIFFVIYTTVWVMGNDNLGTAVRLRVPSYIAIFASMLIIYQDKVKNIRLLTNEE